MPRRKADPSQLSLLDAQVSTAPCVPAVREAVGLWREKSWPGVSPTTRALLNYWFRTDHRQPNGRRFKYHDAQREAIETLIYLYEVAKVRRQKELVERFAIRTDLRLLQHDDYARYGIKMATGSGKTKVMVLAVAWQYFNAILENADGFARTFLVLAPNVIVFERLRLEFAGGVVFSKDPVIPPDLQTFWDFDCYVRGDAERATSQGALYLTNIQQLYQRQTSGNGDEPDAIAAVLGPKVQTLASEADDFDRRIVARGGPCLVINDEAHHTHDEKSEWNSVIRCLYADLCGSPLAQNWERGVGGVRAGGVTQLDFSATPRHSKGQLFTWTVYDYPLKQAIIDNIVKRPVKGIAAGIKEQPSDVASVRYRAYITAGVERWREYREQLAPLKRKPLLFVMLNDTAEADDVGDYLRTKYPDDFGDKRLLVIHTDRSGEISKSSLDAARETARQVDFAESPVNAIVSVLMLREGWDVQGVTVVVGLRPYSAKANILPEQTIGRGLRLMFWENRSTYQERVDVIGNGKFIEFVEQLEREENLELDTFEVGKDKLTIVTIAPDPEKMERDIELPSLSPILTRKSSLAEEIAALDVCAMNCPRLPRKDGDLAAQQFRYEGYDILTLQKLIEREYTIPEPQTAQEVISYYAKRIAQDVKLPGQFAALVPKVREFLETRAFGEPVTLGTPEMIRAIASNVAQYVTVKTFAPALCRLVVDELSPRLLAAGRKLSETPPFPFSRPTTTAAKTVYNLLACDNDFERRFGLMLESAPDVSAFAKLPPQFGFVIEYTDSAANLRLYEPDFVAVSTNAAHYLLETKGREDVDVAHKDRAARLWCENATLLTGTPWAYLLVRQEDFEALEPSELADLLVFQSS